MITEFELNGHLIRANTSPGTTLLKYLRQEALFSVKHGCDHGECGACAVLINGKSINSCLVLLHTVQGKKVETLESFSTHEQLHKLQESFLESGAVQCGFCTPGMLLSLEALDREHTSVTPTGVADALTGNLCRCTGYIKPVEAALKTLSQDEE